MRRLARIDALVLFWTNIWAISIAEDQVGDNDILCAGCLQKQGYVLHFNFISP